MPKKPKKVLFIGSKSFNYETIIGKEIERRNCEVDFYDERLRGNFYDKFALRYLKSAIERRKQDYYLQILERYKNEELDYLFVLRGEIVPGDFLKLFRVQHPACRMKLMMWDSIENYPQMAQKLALYDDVFSFDLKDCKNYNLKFRPLFYHQKIQQDTQTSTAPTVDLSFVGTIHSDRLYVLDKIRNQNNYSTNFVMFLQGKPIYYARKLIDSAYFNRSIGDFKFEFLSGSEVKEVFRNSAAVIDIHHPGQSGLTMRTLEVLGLARKLITTNAEIVEYDFYHPNNMLVIDRKNPIIPPEFMQKPFIQTDQTILERYSLESFVDDIFYDLVQ